MANLTRWEQVPGDAHAARGDGPAAEQSFVRPDGARADGGFVPALDLSETEEAYLVEAAVPGLKAEDLDVTMENGVLTIRGEVRQETEEKKRNFHRVERRFGSFVRSVGLPVAVKADAIRASLADGVLRLGIPKAEEVKPRKISVAVNAG